MTNQEAQNKAIVRRFYDAFEANDKAAMLEVLAKDLVAYTHGSPGPQTRGAMLEGVSMWNGTFSGTLFTIEEQIAEEDKVASRVIMRSIHDRGDFQGLPPSGKQIESHAVTIERIKDGKIVERRVISDWMSTMQQLGLVPPPQGTGREV